MHENKILQSMGKATGAIKEKSEKKMKPIVSLLLVLLFASCGKKEVYEFETSATHFKTLRWDRKKTLSEKEKELPDWLLLTDQFEKEVRITLKLNLKINFTPIDEEGVCFYQINDAYQKVNYSQSGGEFEVLPRKKTISSIRFYDKFGNKLFDFPFNDSNKKKGKTKSVSRALLERVKRVNAAFTFELDRPKENQQNN